MFSGRALAVDGHGVVYHREREVVDAFVKHLRTKWGLSVAPEEAKQVYLSTQERAFSGEITYTDMLNELCSYLKLSGEKWKRSLHKLIQQLSAAITLEPGVSETLHRLRERNVRVGMLTNSIHPSAVKRKWLEQQGIAAQFDLIFSSAEERHRKPAPEIFRQFAAKVGLRPAEVVFVGHDIHEIAGAKEAGMITVCLRCESDKSDFRIEMLRDLLELPVWEETNHKGKEA